MSRFAIVLAEQPYRLVFAELCESLEWGLRALGHDVQQCVFPQSDAHTRHIIIAPHLLMASPEGEAWTPARGTIVYNFEPECSPLFRRSLQMLTRPGVVVWDYALKTCASLAYDGKPVLHVPFAFAPPLRKPGVEGMPRDIDVVFVGSRSPRRERMLHALYQKGMPAYALFGHFGPLRDSILARARAVLNVHFWDDAPNEDLRILTAAANGLAVSSEGPPDEPRKVAWAQWSTFENLAAMTYDLVSSDGWRVQAQRGQEAVLDSPNVADVLREALR